jgi:hypothetical protein
MPRWNFSGDDWDCRRLDGDNLIDRYLSKSSVAAGQKRTVVQGPILQNSKLYKAFF